MYPGKILTYLAQLEAALEAMPPPMRCPTASPTTSL